MNDNSFFSLDKLVEFGMGMGIAQQMMSVMNRTLNEMHVPNAGISVGYSKPGYFALIGEKTVGPLSDNEMRTLIDGDKLTAESFVWKEGMPGWKQVKNMPEIYKYVILKSARK